MPRTPITALANGTAWTLTTAPQAVLPLLAPHVNVPVTVVQHGLTTPVTVYADESSDQTLEQPLQTGQDGTIAGWLDVPELSEFGADLVLALPGGDETVILCAPGLYAGSSSTSDASVTKQEILALGLTAADVAADPAGAAASARGYQPLAVGGFRRVTPIGTPILDLSANADGVHKTIRNPRGFKENGVHHILFDTGATAGAPEAQADIGYATGPTLTQLTYQGVVLTAAQVAKDTGIAFGAITPSRILKDSAGVYHNFVQAVDTWSGYPALAAIIHYTAPTPAGPWKYSEISLNQNSSMLPTDTGGPVYFQGQWVMPFMRRPQPSGSRAMWFATAPALTGPWTVAASAPVTAPNANMLVAVDGPVPMVEGDKLLVYYSFGDGLHQSLVEFASLTATGFFAGHVVQVPQGDTTEANGLVTWGQGSIYRGEDDGQLYALWEGIPSPQASSFYRMHGGTWIPGERYVPIIGRGTYDAIGTAVVASSSGGTTIALPSWLPPETVAIDLMVEGYETSTWTQNEKINVAASAVSGSGNPGNTQPQTGFEVLPPMPFGGTVSGKTITGGTQSTVATIRGRIDLDPKNAGQPFSFWCGHNAATSPKINWTLCGFYTRG